LSLIPANASKVDFQFTLNQYTGTGWHVFIESRSGKRNTPEERNPEYVEGLRLLLQRIAILRLTVADAIVASHNHLIQALPLEKRSLTSDRLVFPLKLDETYDPGAIAIVLRRAQAGVGSRRKVAVHGPNCMDVPCRV